MQAFDSVDVPRGLFFAHIAPPLRPRYYSISSSPLAHASAAHVTAAVVDHATPTGRRHQGVATTMLAQLPPSTHVPAFIRKSTFRLPADPAKPVVMVGPGTGLAPFRGFVQHRRALRECGAQLGSALLFFGCRDPAKDYIYRDELEAALADGVFTRLYTAFSRVSSKKHYVQHRIVEHRCEVFEALQTGGSLYVCGDAKHMARDVHKAMLEVATACNGVSGHEAEEWVAQLQREGRYLQDVW
jgi:NADPH-ferrihemoprotein reductase